MHRLVTVALVHTCFPRFQTCRAHLITLPTHSRWLKSRPKIELHLIYFLSFSQSLFLSFSLSLFLSFSLSLFFSSSLSLFLSFSLVPLTDGNPEPGNMARTRSAAAGNRLRLKDVEKLYPKSLPGSKPYAGFAREIVAWLWYIDPKHEAGEVMRITTP